MKINSFDKLKHALSLCSICETNLKGDNNGYCEECKKKQEEIWKGSFKGSSSMADLFQYANKEFGKLIIPEKSGTQK